MRRIALIALGILIASHAVAEDAAAPDFASMDRDVLVVLARNQHKKIAALEREVDSLAKRLLQEKAARNDLESKSSQVDELQSRIAELMAIIEGDPQARARLDKADVIKRAVEEGNIVVGMTLAQVEQVMGKPGKLLFQTADSEDYEWVRLEMKKVALGNASGVKGTFSAQQARAMSSPGGVTEIKRPVRYVVSFQNSVATLVSRHDE